MENREIGEIRRRRARSGVRLLALGMIAASGAALARALRLGEPFDGWVSGVALALDTALAFACLALAIGLATLDGSGARRAVQLLAVALLVFGLLALQPRFPGLLEPMPWATGAGVALLAAALLFIGGNAVLERMLALLVAAAAALALLAGVYGLPILYGLPVTSAAFLDAGLLLAASCGVLFLRPEGGVPAALLDRSEAGRELRRRLPTALLLPVALGWLALAGERAGWYDGTVETTLLVAAIGASLLGAAWFSYTSLRRSAQERQQARAELAASELRYRRTFEQARIGIAHVGPDGRWLRVNERLSEILGYDASELVGKTYAEVSVLQDLEVDVKQWELLRRGEIADYGVERRFETKKGDIVFADVRIAREEAEDGSLRHLIVVLQDITARKLSEGTLRVYERVLAATQNGVVITDALQDDHPITYVNPAFTSITGYAPADVLGRNCRFLNAKARDQAALDEVRRAIAAGASCSVLLRNHRKDGEPFWNDLSLAPVEDPTGKVSHYVAVISDVTERVQALAEREELLTSAERARQEAEAANRAKDRFLSVVSHELRSPLNAILAWTSLLRDEPGREVARASKAIEASVHAQTRLVNDLLDASRIRAGTLEIEPARIDLAAVVASSVSGFAPIAREQNISLELVANGPAFALADAERLEQVVRNLVDNALKFTPKGGHVVVELADAGESWRLEVRDDGRGITADALPRVFDEFWQEDRAGSGKGLGLGLLIVKHLVERHGGTVRIESDGENRGTVVQVELPKAGRSASRPQAGEAPPDLRGVEVVVVDDDGTTVDAIGAALVRTGAIPRLARSVPEALLHLERGTPEVLVSDIGLPDRDGFDLIRSARGLGEPGRSLLAIAVTGLAGPDERRRIRRAGFDAYLAKPVSPDVVVDRIAKLRSRATAKAPRRRVLVLDSDSGVARDAVRIVRKLGHEVREAHDAAEGLRIARGFEPQLVFARAATGFDGAMFTERLAAGGARAELVGLVDDGSGPSEQGFDVLLTTPLEPDSIDRLLRFVEVT